MGQRTNLSRRVCAFSSPQQQVGALLRLLLCNVLTTLWTRWLSELIWRQYVAKTAETAKTAKTLKAASEQRIEASKTFTKWNAKGALRILEAQAQESLEQPRHGNRTGT